MIIFFILFPGFDVTLPSNGAAFLWFFFTIALFMWQRYFEVWPHLWQLGAPWKIIV